MIKCYVLLIFRIWNTLNSLSPKNIVYYMDLTRSTYNSCRRWMVWLKLQLCLGCFLPGGNTAEGCRPFCGCRYLGCLPMLLTSHYRGWEVGWTDSPNWINKRRDVSTFLFHHSCFFSILCFACVPLCSLRSKHAYYIWTLMQYGRFFIIGVCLSTLSFPAGHHRQVTSKKTSKKKQRKSGEPEASSTQQ